MSSSLIFMEPCQGPATCSRLLMKIGWAESDIEWLPVGMGAVLKATVVWRLPSLTQQPLTDTHDNKKGCKPVEFILDERGRVLIHSVC